MNATNGHNPTFAVELIGPETAKELLESSVVNRSISSTRVLMYATDMKERNWGLASDCIQIDTDGHLRNGHHRMNAVIAADLDVQFTVMRDCPEEMIRHTDTGMTRTLAHFLQMDGWTYPDRLAPLLRIWWAYKRFGKVDTNVLHGRIMMASSEAGVERHSGKTGGIYLECSTDHGLATAEKWGHYLVQLVSFYRNRNSHNVLGITPTMAVFAMAAWAETDYEFACAFWETVTSGYTPKDSDPAIALRNTLIEQRQAKMSHRGMVYSARAIWQMTARSMAASYNGERLVMVKHAARVDKIIQPKP